MKAADVLASKVAEFTRLMIEETGATAPWAGFNVMLAANMLREAAAMTTQISGEVIPSDKPGTLAMGIRQAAGVCVGIAPWNAPVILGTRAVAMPLACGNTVVLKASEMCPGTHRLIGQAIAEAGLPNGVDQRHHQRPQGRGRRWSRRWSRIRRCGASTSPVRPRSAGSSPSWPAVTSSRCCWSSAARRRWWCSTMPTSTARSMRRCSAPS